MKTIAELEALIAVLREAEVKQREELKKKEEENKQRKEEAEKKELEDFEKKKAVVDRIVDAIKIINPSLNAENDSSFNADRWIKHSIKIGNFKKSIRFDATYERGNFYSRHYSPKVLNTYIRLDDRKFYNKKKTGYDYADIASAIIHECERNEEMRKAHSQKSANGDLIRQQLIPSLLSVRGEREFKSEYERDAYLGVAVSSTTSKEKPVSFMFSISKAMSAEEALELYKKLHSIGVIGYGKVRS